MSAHHSERPAGPRFNLRAQRGEARLHARAPVALALGSLRELELVAGEIGSTLDLRQGAIALRNRRTHAVRVVVSLDVASLEQALRALGVLVSAHAGPSGEGAFGLTLSTATGPIDCEVRARVTDGALQLQLTHFASTLPRLALVEVVREALRPVERAAASHSLTADVSLASDERALQLTVEHAVEGLLAGSFSSGGWRLPRTRGLCGAMAWSDATSVRGPALVLATALDPTEFAGAWPGDPSATRPQDAPRLALGATLDAAPRAGLDLAQASHLLEDYLAHEPSPVMRADALLLLAELVRTTEPADRTAPTDHDTLVTRLALRALALRGHTPDVARRVLALARQRVSTAPDEPLLAAVFAAPLPAVQQAALVLDVIPALALTAPTRARAWLERARPFATDLSTLRAAEAAVLAAERPADRPPESLARSHERAAEALAGEGHAARAADAFARAARAYQQARDAQAAARCWVACVSSAPGPTLALDWVLPGASALQLAGRTQDALALLATLLARDVGAQEREALGLALDAAQRFHQSLPAALAAPELFAARRRQL